jgi:7-keto-8-aminopelargonate synthetase-like enzyme
MILLGSAPGRTLSLDGDDFLYFSGTAYLGIPKNLDFRNILLEGLSIYGSNYGNSRISNIQLKIFDEAEQFLAEKSGAQAALTVSSGYVAGQLAFNLFADSNHIFYAPNVHPAVCANNYQPFPGSFNQWKAYVFEKIKKLKSGSILLISNSLDPLFLEPYDFEWLKNLPDDKSIRIIIDDSHGYGITGKNGGGLCSTLSSKSNINIIFTASLGKACGIPGGVIFSSQEIIEYIKSSLMFSGSSPIVPAYLYTMLQAQKVYGEALNKLKKNIQLFQELIKEIKLFNALAEYPVLYTHQNKLYDYLKNNKIIISSFPYPSPESPNITRIVLSSLHEDNDIKHLASLVKEFQN